MNAATSPFNSTADVPRPETISTARETVAPAGISNCLRKYTTCPGPCGAGCEIHLPTFTAEGGGGPESDPTGLPIAGREQSRFPPGCRRPGGDLAGVIPDADLPEIAACGAQRCARIPDLNGLVGLYPARIPDISPIRLKILGAACHKDAIGRLRGSASGVIHAQDRCGCSESTPRGLTAYSHRRSSEGASAAAQEPAISRNAESSRILPGDE